MGHIKMMSATQPFISGAISKTVNLPHDATIDEIAEAYIEAWREGLKAVAIYRDGSKGAQPLNVSDGNKAKEAKGTPKETVAAPSSPKMITHADIDAFLPKHHLDLTGPPRAARLPWPEGGLTTPQRSPTAGRGGKTPAALYKNGRRGEIFPR